MRVEQRSEQRLPAVKMQPPQSFTRKAGELTSPSHEHLVSFLYGKKRHVPRVAQWFREVVGKQWFVDQNLALQQNHTAPGLKLQLLRLLHFRYIKTSKSVESTVD